MRLTLKIVLAALAAAPALAHALPAAQPGMKRWIVTFKPTVKRAGGEV